MPMRKDNEPLLGVCPTGKFVFSHADAIRQKLALFRKLKELKIRCCDLENILPDGLVRDQKHVEPAVAYFRKKGIDAIFMPHCNFGTEGAVGMIARHLGVPVLLWGPRDEAPLADGSRLRDSLCGLLASSGVMFKLRVPFTYIENCRVEDAALEQGMRRFVRAAAVVKAMKNMRLAKIGSRIDFFWSTIVNEQELMERFGVQVLPVDMVAFLRRVKERARKNNKAYGRKLATIKTWLKIEGRVTDNALINNLALGDELWNLAAEENIDAIALQSFSSLQIELGGGLGLAESLDHPGRVPIACETDLHGAISSVLIEAAAGFDEPSFFPEFTVRHPENDNAVLMWHAGVPVCLKDPASKVKLAPPWILKGLPPSSLHFKLKDGHLTVCRFEKAREDYVLGIGQGHTVPGPQTQEFYTWMEVDNWLAWERKLMEGPYIHHVSAIYAQCADILEEACKYISGLRPQRLENSIKKET
jgi:L-fucose isomerase-like protein